MHQWHTDIPRAMPTASIPVTVPYLPYDLHQSAQSFHPLNPLPQLPQANQFNYHVIDHCVGESWSLPPPEPVPPYGLLQFGPPKTLRHERQHYTDKETSIYLLNPYVGYPTQPTGYQRNFNAENQLGQTGYQVHSPVPEPAPPHCHLPLVHDGFHPPSPLPYRDVTDRRVASYLPQAQPEPEPEPEPTGVERREQLLDWQQPQQLGLPLLEDPTPPKQEELIEELPPPAAILPLYNPYISDEQEALQDDEETYGFIEEWKILTNAHCVEHDTQVKEKRRGDDTKYVVKVLARGVECDLALLSVESKDLWEGAEPIYLGNLPNLQDAVTVVGYPLEGETTALSKGVISRIEMTSYAHGSPELLGIQIDAAINPGYSGGPAFNDQGECIGVAFQFLEDYKKGGNYTSFPCLGVLLQKIENPAVRACLNVPTNEGDVIVSLGNIRVGREGTVTLRSMELMAFRYLIRQRFGGDEAELGVIKGGQSMKVQVVLIPQVHLVPYHIEGDQPSYLHIAGLVFTALLEPLLEEECENGGIGMTLLAKAQYFMAKFKGEPIVILAQVFASKENIRYEGVCIEKVFDPGGDISPKLMVSTLFFGSWFPP